MEEKIMDNQIQSQEETPNQEVAQPAPKKSGLKNFLQLVVFILLSMAGFIVQMIIEQVGFRLPFIVELNSEEFLLFGLAQQKGAFIVTMVAVFICKLINFILHRKVLFKARANVAFSIASYIIISVILWIGSAAIKVPVQNALTSMDWWNNLFKNDPEGWALTAAIMVYSTADLIIMFFAEKFIIMNDKLFKKGRVKQEETQENAEVVEEASQPVEAQLVEEVAVDVAQETQEVAEQTEETTSEVDVKQEVVSEEQSAQPQEEVVVVQAEVETEKVAETTQEAQVEQENQPQEIKEEKPAKASTTAKKPSTTAKKTASATAKKTTTAKKTSSTTAKKTTSTASTAKKTTSTTAKKSASTTAKKTASTAKKSTSTTAKKTQSETSTKEA